MADKRFDLIVDVCRRIVPSNMNRLGGMFFEEEFEKLSHFTTPLVLTDDECRVARMIIDTTNPRRAV